MCSQDTHSSYKVFHISDVNHEMDVGLHGWGCPPHGTARSFVPKVHCSQEGFLYFKSTVLVFRLTLQEKVILPTFFCGPERCTVMSSFQTYFSILYFVAFLCFFFFFCLRSVKKMEIFSWLRMLCFASIYLFEMHCLSGGFSGGVQNPPSDRVIVGTTKKIVEFILGCLH